MFYTMYPHTNLVAGSAVCVSSVYVYEKKKYTLMQREHEYDDEN